MLVKMTHKCYRALIYFFSKFPFILFEKFFRENFLLEFGFGKIGFWDNIFLVTFVEEIFFEKSFLGNLLNYEFL